MARKDADNRRRGVECLKKTYGSGRIKKESLNRNGYSKYIEITKDVGVTIDEQKVLDDQQTVTRPLFLIDEQRSIQPLFDLKNYFG